MLGKFPVWCCVLLMFWLCANCSAQMLFEDDFTGPQEGLWAPMAWFPLDAHQYYTREGRFVMSGFTFLTLDFGRKPDLINRAGGFVIEIDVTNVRGTDPGKWVVVKIGKETGSIKGGDLGVIVYSDYTIDRQDQAIHREKTWDIGTEFDMGETIRFEIYTNDVGATGKDATANVYFGDAQVVSGYKFQWDRGPTYLCLGSSGPATFDNLKISLAEPVIEFAQACSAGKESAGPANPQVVLRRPEPHQKYSVDYSLTGGTAGHGDDFELTEGTLTFEAGNTIQTIKIDVKVDGKDEFDETIEVTLKNPIGPRVRLGRVNRHTYTIIDHRPLVYFDSPAGREDEDAGQIRIPVSLSHTCAEPVTVDYAVTGGTAANGKDYKIRGRTLRFEPGSAAQDILVEIIDDPLSENSISETVRLALDNPKNARLRPPAACNYAIVDNEPGIEFDGCVWIPSFDKHTKNNSLLFVNESGQLVWVPFYGAHLTVKVPAMDVTDVGDVAELTWLYKADGPGIGSGLIDLTERWGSGDFRWGFFDSNGRPVSPQRHYGRLDKSFCGYLGYQARLSPHVLPEFRADKWAKRVKPNGRGCDEVLGWGDNEWANFQYYTGHGQRLGEFSPLSFRLERSSDKTMLFSVTLNGVTHTYVDEEPANQPKKIDAMAIYFANPRLFERVTLAKVEKSSK